MPFTCLRVRRRAAKHSARRLALRRCRKPAGRWHDWLLLQQLSEDFHGRKAELSTRYGTHASAALAEYRLRLNEMLPGLQGNR